MSGQTITELVAKARQKVNGLEQSGYDTEPIDDALDALTAQLQAARATIAEMTEATDARHGSKSDRLLNIAMIGSRADTSAHDAAILAARVKELRDSATSLWADESAERGTTKAQHNAIYATWLEQRAASIEQTEAK